MCWWFSRLRRLSQAAFQRVRVVYSNQMRHAACRPQIPQDIPRADVFMRFGYPKAMHAETETSRLRAMDNSTMIWASDMSFNCTTIQTIQNCCRRDFLAHPHPTTTCPATWRTSRTECRFVNSPFVSHIVIAIPNDMFGRLDSDASMLMHNCGCKQFGRGIRNNRMSR